MPDAPNKWQQLLSQMNQNSGGEFFFPKSGKTRFRIVPQDEDETFFVESEVMAFGKIRSKYVISVLVLGTDQGELGDRWKNRVVPMIVSFAVVKQILNLLAEDYDLLDPLLGHGLSLVKAGQGRDNTTYSVTPSPKPIPLPENLIPMEKSLQVYAQMYSDRSEGGGDEAPSAPRGRRGGNEVSGDGW